MRIEIPQSLHCRSNQLRSALLVCGTLIIAAPLHAQDDNSRAGTSRADSADRARAIKTLGLRQADAVKRLVRILDDAKALSQDLRG